MQKGPCAEGYAQRVALAASRALALELFQDLRAVRCERDRRHAQAGERLEGASERDGERAPGRVHEHATVREAALVDPRDLRVRSGGGAEVEAVPGAAHGRVALLVGEEE